MKRQRRAYDDDDEFGATLFLWHDTIEKRREGFRHFFYLVFIYFLGKWIYMIFVDNPCKSIYMLYLTNFVSKAKNFSERRGKTSSVER